MNFSRKQLVIVGAGLVLCVVVGALIYFNRTANPNAHPIHLTIWGVEDEAAFSVLLLNYRAQHPEAHVSYMKVDSAAYSKKVLDALASGEGPDVFMLLNSSFPKEESLLAPADPKKKSQISLLELRQYFPQVVEQDFGNTGLVYALPLSIDTLALFYNKDLFDQAGIVTPPKTWDEFQTDVALTRKINDQHQVTKAGAAIGGSERTVVHGMDLLELLMLQSGTEMTDKGNQSATFGDADTGSRALNFYLQFANTGSPYYTWNDSQPSSLKSFGDGSAAMVVGYESDLAALKVVSPYLNVRVAPVPQTTGGSKVVTYARYWGLGVSKQSKAPSDAWDLVVSIATDQTVLQAYQKATGKPPALLSLIEKAYSDPELTVFAHQILTARSWYQVDDEKINAVFNQMIVNILSGKTDPARGLHEAQDQVSQLMAHS